MLINHDITTEIYFNIPIQVASGGKNVKANSAFSLFFTSPRMATKYSYFTKVKDFVSPFATIFGRLI